MRLEEAKDIWQLNGAAASEIDPCASDLRPGRYSKVTSARSGGIDFHILSVHADSGRSLRDLDHRTAATERIDEAVAPFVPTDGDVITLGHFNTMGTEGGVTAETEIADLVTGAANEPPGFEVMVIAPQCTELRPGRRRSGNAPSLPDAVGPLPGGAGSGRSGPRPLA